MVHRMHVRIMIVEDDAEILDEYRRLINEQTVLQLAAVTDDPEEALRILKTTTIDALILELELAKGSGILLLKKLNMLPIEKPFIIVVTNVVSKSIYSAVRDMGVDYICVKSDGKFSVSVPLAIIEICTPYRKSKECTGVIAGKVDTHMLAERYRRFIEFELSEFGFPPEMQGTKYIQEALLFLMLSGETEVSPTKEMYPYIALKFKTNPRNVERGIRVAIEKVWTEKEIYELKERYPYEWSDRTGRPTNTEFLRGVARKLLEYHGI